MIIRWLGAFLCIFLFHDQVFGSTTPTKMTSCSTSTKTSLPATTITADPLTVTETVIAYTTTSVRITNTREVTLTLTDLSTRTATRTITTTALSITQATVTTKLTARLTLTTTLTRVFFTAVTETIPTTIISTAVTETSTTDILIVSLLRSTRTLFFQSSFAVTGVFTTEIFTTNTRTIQVFEQNFGFTSDPTAVLTIFTATNSYIIDSTLTLYRTTITIPSTSQNLNYAETIFTSTFTIPTLLTVTQTRFAIDTIGIRSTVATTQPLFPISVEFSTVTTLIT